VSTTQAQAAVMDSTAARFERTNEVLDRMLSRLMTELSVLHTQWQGAGGRSFEQVKEAWAEQQAALHRALGETAASIRAAGRGYRTADDAASGRVGGLRPGHLTLPL
jgi:WXG100 family type VII secretion target